MIHDAQPPRQADGERGQDRGQQECARQPKKPRAQAMAEKRAY